MNKFMPELEGFVKLHGSRIAHHTGREVAYLAKFDGSVSIDCEIKPYSIKQLTEEFDENAPLIRWVIKQIKTHDQDTEKVLGLIFNNTEIVCHVVQIKRN